MQDTVVDLFISALKELAILATLFLFVLSVLFLISLMNIIYVRIYDYFTPFNI